MEGIASWGAVIKGIARKNKQLSQEENKDNSRKQICAEQLSKRIQKDLGIEVEYNNAADYTKYL